MTVQGSHDLPFDRCGLCGRWIVERGARLMIEGAWSRDGTAIAVEFLHQVATSRRQRERDRFFDLRARMVRHIGFGHPLDIPGQLNDLTGDVWEFKAGTDRVTFYETVCGGKPVVRLLHHFSKGTQHAPRNQIFRAVGIMKEDQSHDDAV